MASSVSSSASSVRAARSFVSLTSAAVYVAATFALTWPLGRRLGSDVPGDLGDPLFNAWVLAWDATHLGRGWWSANIFAPHPFALAYSEHLLPQALQIWPVYAATGNPILCYNVVFLSTFVLAAIAMFAFARELTGDDSAAFVAGLAFAFTPYRIASIPHMQVLSAAWMPLVLLGFRRHVVTRRVAPLAGGAAAWALQNLSCGYYLLFFSPVALAYVVWELWRTGAWRERRVLAHVAIACAAVAAITAPFLLPYIELRRLGFNPRSLDETRRFSADVYAYFTADPNLRLWGPVAQAWPHAEGVLFPGLTIAVLAIVGAWRGNGSPEGLRYRNADPSRLPVAQAFRRAHGRERVALQIAGALWLAVVVALLLGLSIRLPGVKITSFARALAVGAIGALVLCGVSPRTRAAVRAWLTTPAGFFTLAALFAVAMSFGPDIHARGRTVASGSVYTLFYAYVPGFDGLRVPARFATIVSLALAALAALAIAGLRGRRRVAAIAASALTLGEAIAVPIPINQNSTEYRQRNLAPLPASVATGRGAPPVYDAVAQLPPTAVVLELPLGEPAFDVRYMFYSTRHWRRLVNGYSGGAPESYEELTNALIDSATQPDRAWRAIAASTATHIVVHENAYASAEGRRLSDWLRSRGAHEAASFDGDRLFALR